MSNTGRDNKWYNDMTFKLKAVRKEIRQNVPHLKMMDDINNEIIRQELLILLFSGDRNAVNLIKKRRSVGPSTSAYNFFTHENYKKLPGWIQKP